MPKILGSGFLGRRCSVLPSSFRSFSSSVNTEKQPSSSSTSLPSEADAVVVGGGSIGSSIAFHLQRRGLRTVLLERDLLTSGTTWHSAGMLWRLRPSYVDIELQTYTREMCKWLEQETEIACWGENGGLFIANNKERFDEYLRLHETGKFYGIESHVLAPSEVSAVHPALRTDDIYGALYSPTDGTIDPTGVVNGYAKAARRLGAQIFEKTPLTSVQYSSGSGGKKIEGVIAGEGHEIRTPLVINACGGWANPVSEMVGAPLPLKVLKHAFVVTEPIEGVKPSLPNVRDHDLSIYLKTQGDSLAIGGYEKNPGWW
eukprot:Cvel_28352.t1-p1 / transcript=Cvel_28352.t1 / gene=Cvel_28352 / organism=Chromera_velia_CCMP2878 / gene_product=Sarcosine dehydrogenase, mitochondrial, putative / transcript_product=Sarcosine dehydrogenase, mitochondrial, putative / location=Cvel_scaffold3691:66-1221(-) / protein_length=314 / sequence_SO=supercontig / SO=protein_coding / is_pseudo=false